jgi:hypothetical protein
MIGETVSIDDLAERLEKSADWIRRRVPKFEHLRVGRSIRFTPAQAETFIRSFAVLPGGDSGDDADGSDPLREQSSKSRNRRK